MMMYSSYAQNVGIGTKDPKNKLHVAGGLRVDSLASKKDSGLILHNANGDVYSLPLTGKKSDVLRGDGSFATAAAPTDAWLLGGNSGTDSLTNYLGTNDNKPLMFRVGGQELWGIFFPKHFNRHVRAEIHNTKNFLRGTENIALGTEALGRVFGSKNIGIGQFTLRNLTGKSNIAIGAYALFGSSTSTGQMGYGDDNIAIGEASLSVLHSGSGNIAIGQRALAGRDPGIGGGWAMEARDNVAIGTETMLDFAGVSYEGQPSQGNNTAVGTYSQRRNQAASYNTSIGQGSLHNNTLGNYNTASGGQSLFHSTGSNNTATGFKSMFSNIGRESTIPGQVSKRSTSTPQVTRIQDLVLRHLTPIKQAATIRPSVIALMSRRLRSPMQLQLDTWPK